jgi:hypothetical protein
MTIQKVLNAISRRSGNASSVKIQKPPVRASSSQRKTALPYPQRVLPSALSTFARRGITLQQLMNPKVKSPSFTDVMLAGYAAHKAARIAKVAAEKTAAPKST